MIIVYNVDNDNDTNRTMIGTLISIIMMIVIMIGQRPEWSDRLVPPALRGRPDADPQGGELLPRGPHICMC